MSGKRSCEVRPPGCIADSKATAEISQSYLRNFEIYRVRLAQSCVSAALLQNARRKVLEESLKSSRGTDEGHLVRLPRRPSPTSPSVCTSSVAPY